MSETEYAVVTRPNKFYRNRTGQIAFMTEEVARQLVEQLGPGRFFPRVVAIPRGTSDVPTARTLEQIDNPEPELAEQIELPPRQLEPVQTTAEPWLKKWGHK